MTEAMTASHTSTMNLRFIEREIAVSQTPGSEIWTFRKVRILQQMFVPKDWSTGLDEFWMDVPFVEGDFSNTQALRSAVKPEVPHGIEPLAHETDCDDSTKGE